LPFDSIAPVGKIVTEKIIMEYDSLLVVTFYDRFKKPLANNAGIRVMDQQNRVHDMQTDEQGQVEINRFLYHRIFLEPVLSIYGVAHAIDVARESIQVYLNLPHFFLYQTGTKSEKPQPFYLQQRRGGLYRPGARVPTYRNQSTN
jgi:hypothetical protein